MSRRRFALDGLACVCFGWRSAALGPVALRVVTRRHFVLKMTRNGRRGENAGCCFGITNADVRENSMTLRAIRNGDRRFFGIETGDGLGDAGNIAFVAPKERY